MYHKNARTVHPDITNFISILCPFLHPCSKKNVHVFSVRRQWDVTTMVTAKCSPWKMGYITIMNCGWCTGNKDISTYKERKQCGPNLSAVWDEFVKYCAWSLDDMTWTLSSFPENCIALVEWNNKHENSSLLILFAPCIGHHHHGLVSKRSKVHYTLVESQVDVLKDSHAIHLYDVWMILWMKKLLWCWTIFLLLFKINSYSASHNNWCTETRWNRVITAQCEGMGEVGSARYEPALLPPCPSIRALCYSNCQRSTQSHQQSKG